ncbi:hypothetical protein P0D71_00625 [Paraburkholderia sp. RL17-383-BIF-A]|uniref:gp53-like domain-containing protein n=1 Tax=Paraburkholderia sp. RL17-383-BIF-A TaxID=3031631 RepID=UPI0038BD2289
MYQIDSSGSVTSQPTPAAAGTPGWFTGGNPATGVPATILDSDWFNAVQAELLAILSAASIAPVKGTNNQLIAALNTLFASLGGNASQTFSVAGATQAAHAVNLGEFVASLAINGYVKIPVFFGGAAKILIFQWVRNVTGTSNSSGLATVSVNFPISFPTGILSSAFYPVQEASSTAGMGLCGQGPTTSGVLVNIANAPASSLVAVSGIIVGY